MDRRTAIKALAALPVAGFAGTAVAAAAPATIQLDAAGQVANADEVFAGVSWVRGITDTNLERREVLAVLPAETSRPVLDEPPTWDGVKLVPPPKQTYHGVVRVRQFRYVKLPYAKLNNPTDSRISRTPKSTLAVAR